jgi:hypothetical protein
LLTSSSHRLFIIPSPQFTRPYLEKVYHKKTGLVEWLKKNALSSCPSTTKKEKKLPNCLPK